MNKFEKKLANKDSRIEGKKEVRTWDQNKQKGKKSSLKACPGWRDHSGQRRKVLTFPCETCNRKFCSEECFETHRAFCQAKFYFQQTGDVGPLLEVAKATYDKYVDEDGWPKDSEHHNFSDMWIVRMRNRDLQEAYEILKKNEISYLRDLEKKA